MSLRKHGTGEVLPSEPTDPGLTKQASTEAPWTPQDDEELAAENAADSDER